MNRSVSKSRDRPVCLDQLKKSVVKLIDLTFLGDGAVAIHVAKKRLADLDKGLSYFSSESVVR